LDDIHFIDHACGANRLGKAKRDIALLQSGLAQEPGNQRYWFYLANSFWDDEQFDAALGAYRVRAELGGWSEEVFYSQYRIGKCLGRLGDDDAMTLSHLATYQRFPHRAEPLHALALHYHNRAEHPLVRMVATEGLSVPMPDGALFVESEVYQWRLKDLLAVSLYWLDSKEEAAAINQELLELVPAAHTDRIQQNLELCKKQDQAVLGWFYQEDRDAFNVFGSATSGGDLLEIGVCEGSSAVAMGHHLLAGERFVVCDLWENIDNFLNDNPTANGGEGGVYADLTLNGFLAHWDRNHSWRPDVRQCSSTDLNLSGLTFRFAHIDGCHQMKYVAADIALTVPHMADLGVLALDDYTAAHVPGVAAAIWQAQQNGLIYPFLGTPNKLYVATNPEAQRHWLNYIKQLAWEYESHEMGGYELLIVGHGGTS
jgi:tetratricopeptide (TPR) repeat protein